MQLQLCDGVKKSWLEQRAALIFLTALIFLYRPVMAAGFFTWSGITIFTEGLFVFLAMGLFLLRKETFSAILKNTGWSIKVCVGILLLLGVLHWIAGGYHRPEYLGISLYWAIIPIFASAYRNDLERNLPKALGFLWIFNVIVCIWTETYRAKMFGITGNWNWSAILMLVSFPFALRCVPLHCKGRKIYLASMWIVTLMLMPYLQSRAAMISLVTAAAFWCFLRFRKFRLPMTVAGIILLAAGILVCKAFPDRVDAFLKNEIRVEIWKGTVNLIRDVPTGVGVVSFENSFIPYRTEEYFLHPHCSPRDDHPHNEFLYMAATLGIAAPIAFLVWIIMAFVSAVREYDTGMMSRKRVLFLLCFVAVLCNSMLDLTMHVWPVGILGLLFFGMFAFPGKRVPEILSDGPANRIGKTVIGFTVLLAAVNFAGTFCWDASHIFIARKNLPAAKKYAKTALLLTPEIPNQVYRSANEMLSRDAEFSMTLVERIQDSPWKDYAHIHGLKSLLYRQKGEYQKAVDESLREAECFPLLIRPLFDVGSLYQSMGIKDFAPYIQINKELTARVNKRNLTPEQIQEILRNPVYDMHPERIGKIQPPPLKRWELP